MKRVNYLLFILVAMVAACRKPYNPPPVSDTNGYLVVEGTINSGADSTFIKVSHTVNVASKVTLNPVLNAVLTVEGDQNTTYPLTEKGNGMYACAGLNLNNAYKYRLNIKTAENKQYVTDYMAILNAPPIDSVNYDTKGTVFTPGVNVYVNTHDATNKVVYYRWDYQETWLFHANFESLFKSNGDTVLGRDMLNDNIYSCWQTDTSSSILLGSSAKLSKNVIFQQPLTSIASTSEKVEDEYSILVKQYALTADAYNFYTNLKKNTEQLGSIFDAQPSQLIGNIHSVNNPSEPVIGYVGVGSSSSVRIYIHNQQLPAWKTIPYYTDCQLAFNQPNDPNTKCCYYVWPPGPPNQVNAYINYLVGGDPNPLIPIDAIAVPGHPPIGYTAAFRQCADCTLRGTNKKPAFWKY
ncbi:DUF4249 domain-containing protein [Mucilaginibacter gotjawali]|uniref:Uncharacterized protein n=2 Tax=Mucilaginibacter gotjawali TaxID=1550579 RepID=A0A0X8X2C2_9SPHI|nr:DUF4249 domain-containing protein [Mucilaginibacter gotjawali]MBB3054198.1 hypothetical protein [Mucilaginibacter gotjawali]BAU54469.1 hypothetical protein MgSA37_02645 [Mucilaginibacter gotjawali]